MLKTKNKDGFTLVESLVAMVVMAVGLLGLAAITVVTLRTNTLARQRVDATNIAASLMDSLRQRANTGTLDNCAEMPSSAFNYSCTALREAGITEAKYYPQMTNGGATNQSICGVEQILEQSNTKKTFDVVKVTGNAIDLHPGPTDGDFSASSNLCTLTGANGDLKNLPANSYIRYFRTFEPTTGSQDRVISVVVLWKDRFGRWQNVHLSTQK